MNILNSGYIIPVILCSLVFMYTYLRVNNKFYKWISDHWFYEKTIISKVSDICFILAVVLMLSALLDFRGQEINVEGKMSAQKTIILVDSSASMLVEDVRPNRFKKSLLLIKHFVKKAIGQQISIVVFSDGTKRIVPFTDDVDLIEARINSIEELTLKRGGTGLSMAIQESVQYFSKVSTTEDGESAQKTSGNILILTDAEETELGFDLDIPENISVGVIGVGTARGGPIPVRDNRGNFLRNKRYKGSEVTSRLDEKFLKSLGTKIKNFKYWVATSYSIPTEEILSFFTDIHNTKESKNNYKIKPVLANYLLVPGFILIIISLLLRRLKLLKLMYVFVFLLMSGSGKQSYASSSKKEPVKSQKTIELENSFVSGELDEIGANALADSLLNDDFSKEAQALYEENLSSEISEENKNTHFNYATALLKNKKNKESLSKYKELLEYLTEKNNPESREMIKDIKENILKAFSSNQGGSGEKEEKNKEDKNDKNKEKEKNKDKQNKDKKSKKDSKENQQKGDDQKNDNKEEDKNKNKNKKEKKDKKKEQPSEDNEEKKKQTKEKGSQPGDKPSKKPSKLPAILKQLKNQDNQLQKKMIDAKTVKRKSSDKKDW